jgi:hypothetical protein
VFIQEYPIGRYLAFEPPNTLGHEVILPYRIESIASSLEMVERKKNICSPSYMYNLFFPNLDSRDLRSHKFGLSLCVTQMSLKPISFDALSITLLDRPFVNGSVRFFTV